MFQFSIKFEVAPSSLPINRTKGLQAQDLRQNSISSIIETSSDSSINSIAFQHYPNCSSAKPLALQLQLQISFPLKQTLPTILEI